MAITELYWLLLAVFILHNLEEYLTLHHAPQQFAQRVTKPQFGTALVMVTLLALAVALMGTLTEGGPKVNFILSLLPAILVINALFHLGAALYFRGYVPGLVTAGSLVLPLGLYVLNRMASQGLTNGKLIALALATALMLMYPIIRLALWLGGWPERRRHPRG